MKIDYNGCWQLLVSSKRDQAQYIRANAKFHFFQDQTSLCAKHWQDTKDFDNLLSNDQEEEMHEHLCKACLKKKQKLGIK